jgi:hypothetical protein
MYVLNLEKKTICKMDKKTLANFLNNLRITDFGKFGFLHTEKLAKDFIKSSLNV